MGWRVEKQGSKARSPLKDRPLRNPAQSLDEHIHDLVNEKALPWVMMVIFTGFWAGWEWLRWLLPISPKPYMATASLLFFLAFTTYRFRHVKREVELLQLGRDGERAVAQYLDGLREKHYRVFHDIIAPGFNLDHVIISPHGIYTVETKTLRKPPGREATVRLEGGQIRVNGRVPDRDPLAQAGAQAGWLRELLQESTGRFYRIQPIVVFPGWFVEPMKKTEPRNVWVLHPKALPPFIENEPVVLRADEVVLVAFHLSRYIRTTTEDLL